MQKETYEKHKLEALKYDTIRNFRANNKSSYNFISKHGLLSELCSHMDRKYAILSYNDLKDIANKYTNLKEFRIQDRQIYDRIYHLELMDELCSHMVRERGILFSIGISTIKSLSILSTSFIIVFSNLLSL